MLKIRNNISRRASWVEGYSFSGSDEIPIIPQFQAVIPDNIVPFSKRKTIAPSKRHRWGIHFYEDDKYFSSFLKNPEYYLNELKQFAVVFSPDCSIYRDMPRVEQVANIFLSRAVTCLLQKNGIPICINVRWGDERSYEPAIGSLQKGGVYAISTHGCIKDPEDRLFFKKGLAILVETIEPTVLLVHGSNAADIFAPFKKRVSLLFYDPRIKQTRNRGKGDQNPTLI